MTSTRPHRPGMRRLRIIAAAGAIVAGAMSATPASAAPTSFHIITNVGGSNAYLFDGNNAYQRTYATVAQPAFAAVSPDGSYAAISSLGGKASIINLTTHAVTDLDYSSGSSIGKPVFSTDGRYVFLPQRIVTGTSPYKMKVHRVDLAGATPASQTAEIAAITNCGDPAATIQVSGGTDRLWVSCYTNTTLTPLSNLDGGTFSPTAGASWTLGASKSTDIAISADQTTAYLAQLYNGLIKVELASGTETTLATPFGGCSAVLVNAANTYVYGSCGTSNGAQGIYRVPTGGGSVASNLSGAPDNARQIAFGPSESEIWQPDLGFNQSGGTSVMTWTTSALGGGASAQAQTSTPAFNGPSGIAFGVIASAPDAPTGVTATAGDGQATISWTAPASDGGATLTGYTVTASPGGATCTATPPQTSCTVSGLTNGTAYTFSVVATNSVGPSAASANSAAVIPTAPTPDPVAPSGQQSNSQSSSGGNGGSAVPPAPTLAVRGATPSNQVRSVTITSRVRVSGVGSIRQVGTRAPAASARPLGRSHARMTGNALCSATRKAPRAGTFRMTCVLDAATRRELTRRSIRVRLTTTFTAASGQSVRASQIVVLRRLPAPTPAVTG